MKNQTTIQSATLRLAVDDLQLIDKAVCQLSRTTECDYTKGELERISWLLSQVINPEVYQYSDSQIINS